MIGERRLWGLSGALGAGLSIGVGELLAGVFSAVPSPLASIGRAVVDGSPPWMKDFAISVFGTGDKTALAIGTVVTAIIMGWFTGVVARGRPWVAPVVFAGFALLGAAAAWDEPGAEALPVVAAATVSVAAGLAAFLALTPSREEPTDGLADDRSRREFLVLAGAVGATALASGVVGRRMLTRIPETPDVALDPSPQAAPLTAQQDFAIPGLTPAVVPNDEFYRIDTALVTPRIDPATWRLRVTGLVDREISLDYDELVAMDLVDDHVTIACVSNEIGGDLVGNALWTGVRLTDVLERAGVDPGAGQLVGRSVDGFTVGFPPELAFDGREPLVAVGMNGAPLPVDHGFPARLIVPGLYGYVSATKWLSEIELTTWEGFNAYWVPRGWAKEAPIKTQSRIDVPRHRESVTPGSVRVAGVAWAPLLGIEQVEISVDGADWLGTESSAPLSSHAWVQWRTEVELAAGDHTIAVRATDGSGTPQTAETARPRPDGATGHHTIRVAAG